MSYIIGIDIGTTNTKAVAYDLKGTVLRQSNKTYSFIAEKEGYHELDPEVLFSAVMHVLTDVNRKHPGDGNTPAGVSFSSAMHGLIAVDRNGIPLTNMITWADLRSSGYAAKLKNSPAGKRLYERTGTPVHPMSPLCKLMWMKDHLPGIFQSAHKFISIKEFVFFRLFGKYIVDRSVASSTGLLDIYTLTWNEEALAYAGITADRLSTPVPSTHIIRGINPAYGDAAGIGPDVPFIAGASDGCLAHLGSNALQKDDVSITIGTSGAVRIMRDEPVKDPQQRLFNYLLTDHLYLSGGPINNGGNVLQWFAKGFLKKEFTAPEQFESFIQEALAVPAGAEGLIFLPYIYGERAPVWDADARGVFYGVSSVHTISHFMRAIIEGISMALYSILNSIEQVTGKTGNIYASGGFIRSKKWVTLLADVIGKRVFVMHAEDSSAAGAALLGMKALGLISDWNDVPSFFSDPVCFEPDLSNHEVYRRNYDVYSNLYEKLKDLKK